MTSLRETRLLLSVAIHTDRSDKPLSLKLSSNTRYVSDSLLPPLATLMRSLLLGRHRKISIHQNGNDSLPTG